MLSRKIICWLEVKTTLITHAHVTNIVAWYSFINHIHSVCARSAIRRQKIQYWLEKGVFFCCVSVPPGVSSPDNDGFGLAQHVNLSTNSVPRCCNVRKRQDRPFDRAWGRFCCEVEVSANAVNRVHSLGFDPLRSIEPETLHTTNV